MNQKPKKENFAMFADRYMIADWRTSILAPFSLSLFGIAFKLEINLISIDKMQLLAQQPPNQVDQIFYQRPLFNISN